MGAISGWLLERARWKRQRAEKWDEQKRVALSEFVLVLDDATERSKRIAKLLQGNPGGRGAQLDSLSAELETAKTRTSSAEVAVNMFAPRPVLEVANLFGEATKALNLAILNHESVEELMLKNERVAEARKDFFKAVRRDLL